MRVNRRQLFTGTALSAAATTVGLSACSRATDDSSADGTSTVSLAWWGNPVRNKETDQAIKAYMKANPQVTIKPQPGEWSSYWDKLATQVAGHTAPDIIQMSVNYINEYGDKGALLDLTDLVDTSHFAEGTVAPGQVGGKLVGINAGINSLVFMANPAVFQAAGVDLPDDKTWTWDDFREVAAKTTKNSPSGTFGTSSVFSFELLQVWLRQHGKATFTQDGRLGFSAADIIPYFRLMMDFEKDKAMPPASAISEDQGMSTDQNMFAKGKVGIALNWTNQLATLTDSVGSEVTMLRFPSTTGHAKDRQAWYAASMLWSASARTKEPETVGKVIDWWVNSTECANICLDERGLPANTDIVEAIDPKLTKTSQKVAAFLTAIRPELGETPNNPPPGGGQIDAVLTRYQTDILFGRTSIDSAATGFVGEVSDSLQAQH